MKKKAFLLSIAGIISGLLLMAALVGSRGSNWSALLAVCGGCSILSSIDGIPAILRSHWLPGMKVTLLGFHLLGALAAAIPVCAFFQPILFFEF